MPKGSRKRRKLEKDEEIIQDSSEDDLSEILAQIKALEGETSAQSQHQQGKGDVIIDVDAAASSDIAKINEKGTSASMLPAQGSWRNHSLEAAQEAPDDKLNEFRQLFTRPKPCPNCERLIEHPRGVVRNTTSTLSYFINVLHRSHSRRQCRLLAFSYCFMSLVARVRKSTVEVV